MSRREDYVSSQTIVGKQVVDIKGALIGKVSDVAFDLKKPEIVLRITTKTDEAIEVLSSDVQSVEDLILLKKEVKLPKAVSAPPQPPSPPRRARAPPPESRVPEPMIICPNCGARSPSRAKFCPKCGGKMK